MNFIIQLFRFPTFIVLSTIIVIYYLFLLVIETLMVIFWLVFASVFLTRTQLKKSWINTYPYSVRKFWQELKKLWSWVRLKDESSYSTWIGIIAIFVILGVFIVLILPTYSDYGNFMANSYVIKLILNASLPVQIVMFLLSLACLHSLILIFINLQKLQQASWLIEKFETKKPWQQLNSPSGLFFNEIPFGIEFVLNSGFKEYLSAKGRLDRKAIIENVQKAMQSALKQEIDRLESSLWVLATIGSVSPYVGLFGTVWGIMDSFKVLSEIQDELSLAMVAPGISEALIATAMGLFAAIPAVIAYNRSATAIDRLITRYNVLIDDFANFLQRIS